MIFFAKREELGIKNIALIRIEQLIHFLMTHSKKLSSHTRMQQNLFGVRKNLVIKGLGLVTVIDYK